MLVGRKWNIEKKNCLCVTVLCTIIIMHKGTSSCYKSINCIWFDLAWFTSLSSKCLCLQSSLCYIYANIIFFVYILLFTFYWAEPRGYNACSYWYRGPWRGWLTIDLQCCDTVNWVIWPVKSSPKWPIMCRMGRWTISDPVSREIWTIKHVCMSLATVSVD